MFERFSQSLRSTVEDALEVARGEHAHSLEAQHLLLALVHRASGPTASALDQLGLTEGAIRAALDREVVSALQLVGVAAPTGPRPASGTSTTSPRFGQSAKLALERTLQVATSSGDRKLDDRHLLLAIARAEAGVIPRLLDELNLSLARITTALS